MNYFIVLFFSVFVNNVVFNQTYGICPFLGVSKKTGQAVGMGVAVTFVMVAATAVTWPIRWYLLERLSAGYLETIVFILVIAALVQFLETVLRRFLPALHRSLGIYLPLITTNCAVLGVTVDAISASYSYATALFTAAGSGLGFLLAMVLFSGVRSRTETCDAPKAWKGLPLTLAAAAIVTLCFKGFEGLVSIPSVNEAPELYFGGVTDKIAPSPLVSILIAAGVLTGIGLLSALLLTVAARYLAVPTDERIPRARACLPGANCGACGYAGCDGYAKAVATDESVKTTLCVPGGQEVAERLSEVLHRESGTVEKKKAVVLCGGDCEATVRRNDYAGSESCAAAALLYGGTGACAFSCLGYGDCAAVCPQNAIAVVNGVARVDTPLCVGCGLCRDVCPKHVITLLPAETPAFVRCSSHDSGAKTRAACKNGCIGCKKCEKICPTSSVTVENNLAVIHTETCTGCLSCVDACPTGAIQKLFAVKEAAENGTENE